MYKKIYDITAVEGLYNPIRDFLSEVLPQVANDAMPNACLYAMYSRWMEINYPESGRFLIGRNTFYSEVRKLIALFPEWHAPKNQFRVLGYLDKPEPTLRLFGLENWMQDPHSQDPDIKFRLKWERPMMDGILRTKYLDRKPGRPALNKC